MWPKACPHVREGHWQIVISFLLVLHAQATSGNIQLAMQTFAAPSNVVFHNLTPNLTSSTHVESEQAYQWTIHAVFTAC